MKDIFDSIDADKKETVKDGRPWDNRGPFKTHELALIAKTKFLRDNTHFDAKIKNLDQGFTLKTRKQLVQILREEKVKLEQEKSNKEKKKLSKTER